MELFVLGEGRAQDSLGEATFEGGTEISVTANCSFASGSWGPRTELNIPELEHRKSHLPLCIICESGNLNQAKSRS